MLGAEAFGITHRGCKRTNNEDAICWQLDPQAKRALGVVADGMGGYEGGEIASRVAIETATEALAQLMGDALSQADNQFAPPSIEAALRNAVAEANSRIQHLRAADPALKRMGTTLVASVVSAGLAYVVHIGDSRCYLWSGGRLDLKTRDDTVVQAMLDVGEITEADIPRVPFRNVLTKALGVDPDVSASLCSFPVSPGDVLLLCSDGVTDALPPDQWPRLLGPSLPGPGLSTAKKTLEAQAGALIDASLANQAEDNLSLVLIRIL